MGWTTPIDRVGVQENAKKPNFFFFERECEKAENRLVVTVSTIVSLSHSEFHPPADELFPSTCDAHKLPPSIPNRFRLEKWITSVFTSRAFYARSNATKVLEYCVGDKCGDFRSIEKVRTKAKRSGIVFKVFSRVFIDPKAQSIPTRP